MTIVFLGGGNMATALIGGLLAKGVDAATVSVVEPARAAREALVARFGVSASETPGETLRAAETLVLAVKPQDLRAAVAPLAPLGGGQLVISIAAGVRLADIGRWLGGHRRLVRSMPNMPALIGCAASALYAPPGVGAAERDRAEAVLGAVGATVWVAEEALLDAVTALSGSGPAYVFWFIEQLAACGEAMGLPPGVASRLALETVLGAARLAAQSAEAPAALRARVTSKGGTTEAALQVFDEEQLAQRLRRALEAARRRGAELGERLGKD